MRDKEFKVMIVKIFTILERRVEEIRETFNKEKIFFKNSKNTYMLITDRKNTRERLNSRLADVKEQISDWKTG